MQATIEYADGTLTKVEDLREFCAELRRCPVDLDADFIQLAGQVCQRDPQVVTVTVSAEWGTLKVDAEPDHDGFGDFGIE